jgi:Rossmann-like domain
MTKKSKSWPRKRLTSIFVLLLLCGCEAREPAKENSEAEQQEAREAQLLADPAKARPELVRRLRAAVSMRDGLIVVKSQFGLGIAILPPIPRGRCFAQSAARPASSPPRLCPRPTPTR